MYGTEAMYNITQKDLRELEKIEEDQMKNVFSSENRYPGTTAHNVPGLGAGTCKVLSETVQGKLPAVPPAAG